MYKILSEFKILIFYYSSRFLSNHPCSKALGRKRAKRRQKRFLRTLKRNETYLKLLLTKMVQEIQ